MGGTMKAAGVGYEAYDAVKESIDYNARCAHIRHRENGVSYDSNCRVCTRN